MSHKELSFQTLISPPLTPFWVGRWKTLVDNFLLIEKFVSEVIHRLFDFSVPFLVAKDTKVVLCSVVEREVIP